MSGDDGLREVVARTMYEADRAHNGDSDGPAWDHDLLSSRLLGLRDAYRVSADAVLALPELAALRAKAAAADRVRELLPRIDGVIEFDMARERYDAVMSVQQVREHLSRALEGRSPCPS